MECPVCTLDVVDVEDHVNVRVDDGREIHRFHKSCFDKCARNTTMSKLNPAQLCIFGAQSVQAVERVSGLRCCIVGCESREADFIRVECSHSLCTLQNIHVGCAERKMDDVVKALKKCRNNSQSADALRKTAFASKYDIVKPMCPCACGQGYFRILKSETAESPAPKKIPLPAPSPPKTVARAKSRPTICAQSPVPRMPRDNMNRRECSEPPGSVCLSTTQKLDSGWKKSSRSVPESTEDKEEGADVAWALAAIRQLENSEALFYKAMMSKLSTRDDTIPPLVGLPPIDKTICPITRDIMRDPFDDGTGQRYERIAYKAWIAVFGSLPMSGGRCE